MAFPGGTWERECIAFDCQVNRGNLLGDALQI
jgi:hypothetical protein